MRQSGSPLPARAWRRAGLATVLVVLLLPLTACTLTPAFFACLVSSGYASSECVDDSVAPGPPSAPTGVTATAVDTGDAVPDVRVDWQPNGEVDLDGYRVSRSNRSGGPYTVVGATGFDDPPIPTTFTDSCLIDEGCALDTCTVYYVVTAVDVLGQEGPRSQEALVRIDCVGPPPPASLQATPGDGFVSLGWEASSGVDEYRIYRASSAAGPFALLTTTIFPNGYTDFDVVNGTQYFYRVTAVDTAGNEGDPSAVAEATPSRPETDDPPAAPANLTARGGNGIVTLDWDDNTEPDLAGYRVFRLNEAGGIVELTTGLLQVSHFVIEGVPNGVEVQAWVRAVDLAGNGRPTAPVTATPHAGDPPPVPTGLAATPGDGQVMLDWDDSSAAGLDGYHVYASDAANGAFTRLTTEPVTASQYVDNGLPNGTERFYEVTAIDVDRNESPRSAAVSATPTGGLAAPTGLTATPGPFLVVLDWDDSTNPDVVGYYAYLASSAAGPFNRLSVAPLAASTFTVFDLSPNIPRWFRVTAVDTTGNESVPSAVVTATPCSAGCGSPGLVPAFSTRATSNGGGGRDFKLTLTGGYASGGSTGLDGDSIVGAGLVFDGRFALKPKLNGLDRELRRLVVAGLEGDWRSSLDWRLTPGSGGAATGIALATFSNPQVGEACLRFEQTFTLEQRGKKPARVHTAGTFTLLGGTATAAKLLGGGSFDVTVRPDGTMVYKGQTGAAAGAVRPLPPECLALR